VGKGLARWHRGCNASSRQGAVCAREEVGWHQHHGRQQHCHHHHPKCGGCLLVGAGVIAVMVWGQ